MSKPSFLIQTDYRCIHCNAYVSVNSEFSKVQNRNHCPYCLWSRHLDLYQAGDRLSACKAAMKPIGLTEKIIHKKYGPQSGELMLIHECTDCGRLSINRLAADDLVEVVSEVFHHSLSLPESMLGQLKQTRHPHADNKRPASATDPIVRCDQPGGIFHSRNLISGMELIPHGWTLS